MDAFDQVSAGRPDQNGVVLDAESFDARFAFEILRASTAVTYVYDLVKQTSIFQNRHIGEVVRHQSLNKPDPLGEWVHLMHPEDLKRFPEHRERLRGVKPGEVVTWEYRLRAPDDTWRCHSDRA